MVLSLDLSFHLKPELEDFGLLRGGERERLGASSSRRSAILEMVVSMGWFCDSGR